MGERDAFGREIGEDTLADMGWRADLSPSPEGAPKPQPVKPPSVRWMPPKPQAAPPRTEEWSGPPKPAAAAGGPSAAAARPGGAAGPRRYPRPRRRRGFARLIFFLALIVVVAAAGGSLMRAGKDAIDRGQDAIRGALPTTTAPSPAAGGSLLKAAALRKALKQLPKGQIRSLRLTAGEIDAQVVRHGKTSLVRVTADGQANAVKTPVAIPGKAVHVDPGAPAKIVRAAHKRLADVNYLVLTGLTGKPAWQAYFKNGATYSANAAGGKVRKLA